jgi:hypothetical protein
MLPLSQHHAVPAGILSHPFFAPPAGIGAGFYLGYSWLPSFFVKHAGIPQSLTLWMVLSGMVMFTFVVPVSVTQCVEKKDSTSVL